MMLISIRLSLAVAGSAEMARIPAERENGGLGGPTTSMHRSAGLPFSRTAMGRP